MSPMMELRSGTTRRAFDPACFRNRELNQIPAHPIHSPKILQRIGRCGMQSDKWQKIEDEVLIPLGFGWTVMVMALYFAVVVLK